MGFYQPLTFSLAVFFLLPLNAKVYRPIVKSGSSTGVTFSIPYTAGTHDGFSRSLDGLVETDDVDQLRTAQFTVPIASLTTSNKTRDCHMREALGLDYTISRFPEAHVCDSQDQIPQTGASAIAYPNIAFEFQSFSQVPAVPLDLGKPTKAVVQSVLQIHGITKQIKSMPIQVTKSLVNGRNILRIESRFKLSIKDYGVIVKPIKVGPFSFGVEDTLSVSLNLILEEASQ